MNTKIPWLAYYALSTKEHSHWITAISNGTGPLSVPIWNVAERRGNTKNKDPNSGADATAARFLDLLPKLHLRVEFTYHNTSPFHTMEERERRGPLDFESQALPNDLGGA